MHVLFIHPRLPSQFGHIATYLATKLRWPCTFVSEGIASRKQLPYSHYYYQLSDRPRVPGYSNLQTLPGLTAHMDAVYQGLRGLPQLKPDLVVGHTTFGTYLFLRNLYACPFIGYFEYLPPPVWTDEFILRKEFPPDESGRLSNAIYHAFTYLQLHAADACYTPTHFQFGIAPPELRSKIEVIHDGIDTDFYQPRPLTRPTTFRGVAIDRDTRIVTYVSRGLESMRGFDLFMKVAKNICREMTNVVFFIAGGERCHYGHDANTLPFDMTFKQWVLSQDDYDLSRFHFLGWIPEADLAKLFNLSDLHVYLTAPYILSWSLLQAMASGCTVLGSATPPVQEAVDDNQQGLLVDFYDVDGMTQRALKVLRNPAAYRPLGAAARARVLERYDAPKCINQLVDFFQRQAGQT